MATRLRNLRLSELSLVDSPANKGANVSIFKRATDLLPDGWVSKNAPTNGDGQMDEKAIQKAISDAVATATADLKKQLDASTAQVTALTKMSDKHTAFASNPKASMPKGGKDAFTAMTPAERDAHMSSNPVGEPDGDEATKAAKRLADAVAKAVAEEEVIKIGDREVRKSIVGADMFAIFKAQQADIQKARDDHELVVLQKRADTEFLRLPETSVAKAKVLKAMAGLPEAERASLEKMLKAGNDAIGKSMKVIGADGGENGDDPVDKLDALAKTHAAANKITFHKAYAEVIETEAGRELYAQMGRPKAAA